jgi:mono/diheme cytochrome c family protein
MSGISREEQRPALYTSLKILIVCISLAVELGAGRALGQEERTAGGNPVPASGQSAAARSPAQAGSLYQKYCQRCHESDGTGRRDRLPGIPNFRDRSWHRGRNDFELAASILDGKGTRMPALSERLDERQVWGLVAYLRSLSPDGSTAGRPATALDAGFESRFHQLQKELEDLQKQFRDLSRSRGRGQESALGNQASEVRGHDY